MARLCANFACLILLLLSVGLCDESRQKRDTATAEQPRLLTQDGHLVFQTGTNHNITFRSSSGGAILMDGENFKTIAQTVRDNQRRINDLQSGDDLQGVTERLDSVESSIQDLQILNSQLDAAIATNQQQAQQISDLVNRITQLESSSGGDSSGGGSSGGGGGSGRLNQRMYALENMTPGPTAPAPTSSGASTAQFRRLRRRVTTLENQVEALQNLLEVNECSSNPCRNGGTCVDSYNGYFCRCPDNWQGVTCETDVNECAQYAGTDLGCQNGATCVNMPGSFQCQCTSNHYGIRCTETHDDCSQADNEALCGHGTCINVPRTGNDPTHTCICDQGWTTADGDPACVVDVDECATPEPRCSASPAVQCINLPGSFTCGSCPAGYAGNGFHCADIDECLTNNGGCSRSPHVDCINTIGSRECEPCPPGYSGDGVRCEYFGICNQQNGGCHPLATCTENTNIVAGRTCTCPANYAGSGIGASGCVATTGGCAASPCIHGTCQELGTSYVCLCMSGFTGLRCENGVDECQSNPCLNGGSCTDQHNGFSCTCTDSYTGPTCAEAQQDCGGNLNSEAGYLSYPHSSNMTYEHGVSCAWVISVDANKIIMVTFTRFTIEFHPNCDYDYLQIHDGPSASSHIMGKYCGTTAPQGGTFNSTHNQLYLWFRSDGSVAHDGFALNWRSADPVCGGSFTEDYGVISSPGYPGEYPHNRDCVWTVSVVPGNVIAFSFGHIALEHHNNCSFDYFMVYDGLLETDPILGRYCSTIDPPPITTSGPYALIHFHSDRSLTDTGFEIRYHTQPGAQGCGGRYTAESGTIMSPNFPSPYPAEAQCIYTITVPVGQQVTLTFDRFELESHEACAWDYVEIRDGADETAPIVGRFCGSSVPYPYTSSRNYLWIMFKSDPSNSMAGFSASYSTSCDSVYTAPNDAVIQSPLYPAPYPNDKTCQYLIIAPEGYTILLTFGVFQLEESGSSGCHDYVKIRDGGDESSPLLAVMCGRNLPLPLSSTGNQMWLQFHSDHSIQQNGFQATYEMVVGTQGTDCGGVLTDTQGSFNSPGHPNSYPHGINCTWHINASPGRVIRLEFNTFHLENQETCSYDYVDVYDNTTNPNALRRVGRYCGSDTPPVLTSSDNYMKVVFISDDSIATFGFQAEYVSLNASSTCQFLLNEDTGVIQSPGYPGLYPPSRSCVWRIAVSQGQQIRLNVTDFAMEPHSSCNYDYLEVRDGGYADSPLIGKYCGTVGPNGIISHSNRLFLQFVSDGSDSRRGFQILYDGTTSGCGGDLSTPTGLIISPNYPQRYNHRAECFWNIVMSQGSRIQITFLDLDLESHGTCIYDYVEIRDGGPSGASMGRFCGSNKPGTLNTTTNKAWLKFHTDYSNSGRGFQISYAIDCHTNLTDFRGVIESPNFPNPYQSQMDCVWRIQATLGNTIEAAFSHFNLEDESQCTFDYLQLRDGPSNTSTLIGQYCGRDLPAPVNTSREYLYVHFHSDRSQAYSGFRLEYITDGCGNDFTTPTGGFTSPGYPNAYPHRRECVWRITVEPGHSIDLTIHDFDVEQHTTCNFDVLEVYNGLNPELDPLLVQLCHTQSYQEQTLSSTGNMMYVRFKSDSSRNGRGFNATYTSVPGGCGGNFTTPSGTITSKNFPNPYPDNTSCVWNIQVAELHTVVLTFLDFDVEGHRMCDYDAVTVYDGPNSSSQRLLHACGSGVPIPSTIRSTRHQLYIEMRSDGSVSASGFKANYTTGCGGWRDASIDGRIISPNYPDAYPRDTNCTWTLEAPNTADRVFLTFSHMNIEPSSTGHCEHDSVTVLDGNDENAPEIGKYCGSTLPGVIRSLGSALTIVFQTDRSDNREGFLAYYSTSVAACGGLLEAEHGTFMSPGYPDPYANNMECTWNIVVNPGSSVHIQFSYLDLQDDENCNTDYVEIRTEDLSAAPVARICGTSMPNNITVTESITIKFRSNEDTWRGGFVAGFTRYFGGEIFGDSGQLTSPYYPSNYRDRMDVAWTITVSLEHVILVTFSHMDIEASASGCSFDFLRLRDGGSIDAPLLDTFCGPTTPGSVQTTGNQLYVQFHTDYSATGRGFMFEWQSLREAAWTTPYPYPWSTSTPRTNARGCGSVLIANGTVQSFQNPGWPYSYANNLNCVWTIEAPVGYRIWFDLASVNLERHSMCSYDYVQVFDGPSISSPSMGKYCDRNINSNPLVSTTNIMTVKFRSDYSVSRTGFNATYKSECGGEITGVSGVINSPSYPNNYPANSNCTWTVGVTSGKTVAISFNHFDIASSGGICNDYLQVQNGASHDSPPLLLAGSDSGTGQYCGTSAPSLGQTSGNNMRLTFISDRSVTAGGFQLVFQEQSVTCGGNLLLSAGLSSGEFMSPNYPDDYPVNVDCEWIIVAPANELIQLDFEDDFYIEAHTYCVFDFVQVRDGATTNSHLLGQFCGRDRPSTIKSTGNAMYVRFRTDGSVRHRGFKAKYKIADCGGSYFAMNGTIVSPNYPHDYASNADCSWYIHGPTGHYLTLSFDAFNLQNSVNCTSDVIEIRETNETGLLLAQACGQNQPSPVETSDSFAYVHFTSDNQNTNSGFMLSWVASVEVCGGHLVAPTGVITSPNYPNAYAHSRRCEWLIEVPDNRRVLLEFTDIDIEFVSGCYYDYVAVYNGVLDVSPNIGRFCGEDIPDPVQSSGNTMKVVFYTDHSVTSRGFSASYSAGEQAVCGSTITGGTSLTGTIQSPTTNGTYENNQQCIWYFQNTRLSDSSIILKFTTLEIETHGECSYDFVEVREGPDENGELVGRYCGNTSLPQLTLPSASAWLLFRTDFSLVDVGFELEHKFSTCGGVVRGLAGYISSPNYPQNYDHNDDCAWRIIVPSGFKITLHFEAFTLEQHSKCAFDYVSIYNGGHATAPMVGQYCGSTAPEDFVSQSNEVRVQFHSDGSASEVGFQLHYASSSQGCGGSLHAQTGLIQSTNYPSNYEFDEECTWDITVANGYHVELSFEGAFDLEVDDECSKDFIAVSHYGHDGELSVTERYCGNVRPDRIIAQTNKIKVVFRTDGQNNFNGFQANFSAVCGAYYIGENGMILSPGYPNNYENNMYCNYTIETDPEKFVILEFQDHFFIEGSREIKVPPPTSNSSVSVPVPYREGGVCSYDWLAVYQGNNTNSRSLGRYCGNTPPQAVSALGGMYFEFHTDGSITDKGWVATYRVSECGGVFTEPYGQIQTPTPNQYHHRANCTWLITVAEDRIVELKFNSFELESHSRCAYDEVSVYEGDLIDSDNLLGTFCGDVLPSVMRTVGNTMLVHFRTDGSVAREGFVASYRTTYGVNQGCGGNLNATNNGTFLSLSDESGDYIRNLDCVWQIVAPENHVLQLAFNSGFHLESHVNCSYDYVEVRDGLYATAPLMGRYCGTEYGTGIVTSSNFMYVRFFTDGSVQRPGFVASYYSLPATCGGSYEATDVDQMITSPYYPSAYPHNSRCRWTIDAPEGKQVHLTPVYLQIPSDRDCTSNYMEFRDFPLGDDGRSLLYCGSTLPGYFMSVGRTVHVNLITDATSSGKGFTLNYRIQSCNMSYTTPSGRITSPGYPGSYPRNVRCNFQIQVPQGNTISLFFSRFYIESHSLCRFDYLKIYNGTSVSSPMLANLCGNNLPSPVYVQNNVATFVFRTDSSVQHIGYDITYISSQEGCGGNLTHSEGTFGTIAGVDFAICRWYISIPAQKRVQITFPTFNLGDTSCLTMHNGLAENPVPYRHLCGTDSEGPATIVGTSNEMLVIYTWDGPTNITSINEFRANYTSYTSF